MFTNCDLYYTTDSHLRDLLPDRQIGLVQRIRIGLSVGNCAPHIPSLHDVAGKRVLFIANFSSHTQCFKDLACLMAIASRNPSMLEIVIPHWAAAAEAYEFDQERVSAAEVDAKFIDMLPCAKRVHFFDVHNRQCLLAFQRTAVRNIDTLFVLMKAIDRPDAIVVFLNEKAAKYYENHSALVRYHCICVKTLGKYGELCVPEIPNIEHAKDQNVIVLAHEVEGAIDLRRCGVALRAAGAKQIVAAAPKLAFCDTAHEELHTKYGFHTFYTTAQVSSTRVPIAQKEFFYTVQLHEFF